MSENINKKENAAENKSPVATTVIKSVTALICCATLALVSSNITGKVCDNRKELASKGFGGSAVVASADGGTDGGFSDTGMGTDDMGAASDDMGGDVAADDSSFAGDTGSTGSSGSSSSGSSSSGSSSSGSSSAKSGASSSKEITLTSGLNSSNKAEVLKYYKLVAAKNAKGTYNTKMVMTSLDGGKGGVGALISAFKPIATAALEKNSVTIDHIPGAPNNILESDWESAKAVNDGTYTTINIKLKTQTDGANGKSTVGTVGRTVDVLDGVQTALDELNGVSADFTNGKFSLVYDQAYVTVKVKNSTGEFVKGACKWHYRVNVNLDLLTVKVGFISATLEGGKGTIDYTITY